ncbi:WPP domain-associated protein [Aristolochia californica]|uniref:WPP domain-associated protein n=1 Tax=Aristolochia californica TaxID=171875 RepID=UPI0035DBDEEE
MFVNKKMTDEFFDGLDCRLRVSGMVADSVMMGIVNSTMEEAYRKVCSKEAGLERLNEKSRFCELAIIQLEWCLKFIQEEMDSHFSGSTLEREKLVLDLTETRERIQRRLVETELAITKIDRELAERIENEAKLRRALALKDQELKSLRSSLELEKVKGERVREFVLNNRVSGEENRDGDFCELKSSVDQQFWNIKQQLKDGRVNYTKEMKRLNESPSGKLKSQTDLEQDEGSCSDMNYSVKSDEEGNEEWHGDDFCVKEVSDEISIRDYLPRTELNIAFEQMGADIGVLKAMLEVAFEMMDNAIILSKTGLMEQKWRWTIEKDTVALVFRSFLIDVRERFEARCCTGNSWVSKDWSVLMDEKVMLHHELELLLGGNNLHWKMPLQHETACSSFSPQTYGKFKGISQTDEEYPREVGHVSPLERRGKSDCSLKLEELLLPESPPKQGLVDHASLNVADIIRNHDYVIKKKTQEINWQKECGKRDKHGFYLRKDNDLVTLKKNISNVLVKLDSFSEGTGTYRNEKKKPITPQSLSQHAGHKAEVVHQLEEDISRLKQEIEELNMQFVIIEETSMILYKELVKQLEIELAKHNIKSLVGQDKCTIAVSNVTEQQNRDDESNEVENFFREQIFYIVFNEVVRGMKSSVNLTIDAGKDAQVTNKRKEDFLLNANFQKLSGGDIHCEGVPVEDRYIHPFFNNSSELLHKICLSKTQLRGSKLSRDLAGADCKEATDHLNSSEGITDSTVISQCLPKGKKELDGFKSIATSLIHFVNSIMEFEHTMQEKMCFNIARLKEVQCQFSLLIKHISTLKKTEVLYRKAFARRCYDLQTAEEEVDLLGDEVDQLLGVLVKTYMVLDHYSPNLQNFFGITDIFQMLRKELHDKAVLTQTQQ